VGRRRLNAALGMRASIRHKVLWLLIIGFLPLFTYYVAYRSPLPFIASWWGTTQWDDPYHKRHRIADGMLLTGRLVGCSREEVVGLLGEPPATAYFRDWQLVYNLGAERSWLSIDSEWLVLRLGQDGLVHEAALVRD
jgi:hypothetical protein